MIITVRTVFITFIEILRIFSETLLALLAGEGEFVAA